MTPKQNKMWPILVNLDEDPKSFQEDFEYENGKYLNSCRECGSMFFGHNLRVICKVCFNKESEALPDVN